MNDLFNAMICNIDVTEVQGKTLIYNFVDRIDDRHLMDYKSYKYIKKREALMRKKMKMSRILQETEKKIDSLDEVVSENEVKSNDDYILVLKDDLVRTTEMKVLITKLEGEKKTLSEDVERLNRNDRSLRLFYESKHHSLPEIKEESSTQNEISDSKYGLNLDDELSTINEIKELINQYKSQNDMAQSSLLESVDPVRINIVVKADEFTRKQEDIIKSLSAKLLFQENLAKELQVKLKELDNEEEKFQADMRELNRFRSLGKSYAKQVNIEEIPALDAIKKYYLIESRYRALIEECEKLIPETIGFEQIWKNNIKDNGRAYAIRSLIEYYRVRMIQLLKNG